MSEPNETGQPAPTIHPPKPGARDRVVTWDGKGFGYASLDHDEVRGLIRCPKCESENYAMAVTSGVCCWCGFNARPQPNESETQDAN